MLQEYNFHFDPKLNAYRIAQRKLRRKLVWVIYGALLLFGLLGLLTLFTFLVSDPETRSQGALRLFYLSILADLFGLYFWQRSTERVKKLKLPSKGEKIEIWQYFDPQVKASLENAWLIAVQRRQPLLLPIQLFIALLKTKDFARILKRLDCQIESVREKARNVLNMPAVAKGESAGLGPKISPDLEKVFLDSYIFALQQDSQQISSLDILWAMSQNSSFVQIIFDEFGVDAEEIKQAAVWAKLESQIKEWEKKFSWQRVLKPKGQLNRAMTAATTPILNRSSEDYTLAARQGRFEIILGRDKIIEQIFSTWSAGQPGIVLVGASGIGKKSVIQKIAQRMVAEDVPKFLQDKRMIKLDLGALLGMGGGKESGEMYLKHITHEVSRAGHIILFVEDIDNLVGLRARPDGLDLAEILAAALDKKAFYLIATATKQGYATKLESGILGRVLSLIKVNVPDKETLWQVLVSRVYTIERELDVVFSVDAINQAIELSDRYVYGQALTAKSIDLLEEVASLVRGQRGKGALIKDSDIAELVSRKTDIPLTQVQEVEKKKLLKLEELIHGRVVNQEKAVKAVADALRRGRLHLSENKKPIANFLFVGPTGVGKTELAKTLAHTYFGDEKRMIRLDMSEYQEKRGIRRMIGSKDGEETTRGYLTEAVKRQPHSLILLDEIEKAHPDILNLFLQVMDDGRLTDVSGETINFTNVILIATSNAGTKIIQDKINQGETYDAIEKELKETVLVEHFRPEFLNRFDKIVLFNPLSMENMMKITKLFLNSVKRQLEEKGIDFEVDDEAVKELAIAGFDPLYGARPLRRVIQDKVDNELAKMILEDKIVRRDKVILKKGEEFEVIKAIKI